MSAFIVDKEHIDVLVNAMAQYGVTDGVTGQRSYRDLGQLLWSENVRSVDHRYASANVRRRYTLRTTEGSLNPLAVLKAIDCYEYQSCEHPNWPHSETYSWIAMLRDAIYAAHPKYAKPEPSRFSTGRLVPSYRNDPEYDRQPWECSRLNDALAQPDEVTPLLRSANAEELATDRGANHFHTADDVSHPER